MEYEYRVIEAYSVADLTEVVNDAMREGWELWGNLTVENSRLYQTVVRYQPKGAQAGLLNDKEAQIESPGFAVGVPEMPEPEEHEAKMPLEVPAACWKDNTTVLSAIPILHLLPLDVNAELCCCLEYIADNPDCPVHKNQQPTGVRI